MYYSMSRFVCFVVMVVFLELEGSSSCNNIIKNWSYIQDLNREKSSYELTENCALSLWDWLVSMRAQNIGCSEQLRYREKWSPITASRFSYRYNTQQGGPSWHSRLSLRESPQCTVTTLWSWGPTTIPNPYLSICVTSSEDSLGSHGPGELSASPANSFLIQLFKMKHPTSKVCLCLI